MGTLTLGTIVRVSLVWVSKDMGTFSLGTYSLGTDYLGSLSWGTLTPYRICVILNFFNSQTHAFKPLVSSYTLEDTMESSIVTYVIGEIKILIHQHFPLEKIEFIGVCT